MLEYHNKINTENIRAENIKRNILKYSGLQNSINNIKGLKKRHNDLNISKPNVNTSQIGGSKLF